MAGWIKMPLGMEVGFGPGDCVRWGTQLPQKGHSPPPFSAHVCCGQMAVCISIPLGTEEGLSLGNIVLDGDSAPPRKGAQQPPPLLAHVYCGQTAGWIKIPLGTDYGPGDVLDADPAPSTFGPCLLWPNGPHLSNY